MWRPARSLMTLHQQLQKGAPRAAPPATGVDEWGLKGDAAHDSTSDHTPHDFPGWGSQIVTAADFPNRPDLGLDAHRVLDDIRQSHDPRAKYGISNAQIFSNHPVDQAGQTYPAWAWRPYFGDDLHKTHGHLSVVGDARADGMQPWATIGGAVSDLNDKLPGAWTEHGWNALAVVMEIRKGLWADLNATGLGAPAAGSALGKILANQQALAQAIADLVGELPAVQLDAAAEERIATRTAELVVQQLGSLRFDPRGQS
jgi:hypothetical protein